MRSVGGQAVELLEFAEVRSEISLLCLSEEGKELLERQEVTADPATIHERLDFATALRALLEIERIPSLEFPPVRSLLPRVQKEGIVLEGVELVAMGTFVRSAMQLKGFLDHNIGELREGTGKPLSRFSSDLPELSTAAGRILFLLNVDGTVNEDRVPELKSIRREMQRLHADIAALTSDYLSSDRGIWQSDVPTQRDNRTVLPLKADYRGHIQGIVHEISATGATLFIEPTDIVERNNRLVEQDNRYKREVHRILRELTELCHENFEAIELLVKRLAYFDTIYVRASYAALHNCTRALDSGRRIVLRSARHPLLRGDAVPLDFELGENASIMIITGANAGGKTVALKTVGLLALMNQWGMEIPAAEGSELPIFDRILVDIGDDQSIANSLSTFSGHMKVLSTILVESDASSLVLLDEIGSGTDPAEGSALAMAVLDHLLERKSLVVVTTHQGTIKRYGYSQPGITNASVSFDSATLSPTYRLTIGVPGESHALEIAARGRIPHEVLERASEYVERGKSDVDRAVEQIAADRREIEDQRSRLQAAQNEIDEHNALLHEREEQLEERQRQLREAERGELGEFLVESRRYLENLVRELRTGEINREKTRKVKTFLDKVDEKLAEEERERVSTAVTPVDAEGSIEPGSEVYVGKNRRRGTVIRRERGDKWLVSVKTLRVTVPSADLSPVAPRRVEKPEIARASLVVAEGQDTERAVFELDLRGMRLQEAEEALSRQLDRAILSGLAEFSVIHGKGEGILRQGVHRLLEASNVVREFHFSPPESGGFGKTIVKLAR